jgi:DNA-binding NtrC family response regulator
MAETKRGRLLIVDDETELKSALCETLADEGYETVGASNGAEGLKALERQDFDLLLSDLMMPGMDGIQMLRKALESDPNLVGIIMTGQGTIASAIEAMKVGAFDYVLKPFNLQTMLPILARGLEVRRLRTENVRLRRYVERLSYESPRYQMIGSGPAMQRVVQLIAIARPSSITVRAEMTPRFGK